MNLNIRAALFTIDIMLIVAGIIAVLVHLPPWVTIAFCGSIVTVAVFMAIRANLQ